MLLVSAFLFAQTRSMLWFQSPTNLPNYTPSFNYQVYHDSEGFVWISSTAGINRFDGTRIKNYRSDPADSTTLFKGENIQSNFFEDSDRNLWFATSEAVHCYRRKTDDFQHFQIKNKDSLLIETGYRVFFLEKDSFLWLTADSAIYRMNIYQPDDYAFIMNADQYQYQVKVISDGSVDAIYRIGKIEDTDFSYALINHGNYIGQKDWFKNNGKETPILIEDIAIENDSTCWLGTEKGLVKWNPKSGDWQVIDGLGIGNCFIEQLGSQFLVVWSKRKGLFIYNKSQNKFIHYDIKMVNGENISTEDVFNIYLDHDENLWVSFMGSGLIYANINKTKFNSVPKNPDSSGNTSYAYWASIWDTDGNLWHGSNSIGLFLLNGNGKSIEQFKSNPMKSNSLPSNWVTSLLQDENRRIWVGTTKGLAYMNLNEKRGFHLARSPNNPNLFIIALCQTKNTKTILASTYDRGIFILKNDNGIPTLHEANSRKIPYGYIYEDNDGRIYCDRDEKAIDVFTLTHDSLNLIKSLPTNALITGFYEDRNGKTLWAASLAGLIKINLDSLKVETIFLEKDGLLDKNIHAMQADEEGNLWLSTPKGITQFQTKTGQFRQFSLADGTQSNEFQLLAASKRQNGELWFGGSNGFTIIPPSRIDTLKNKPLIRVTEIKINNEVLKGLKDEQTGATNITEIKNFKLKYNQNTIYFEFAAMEYSDPSNNQLKYFLKGMDSDTVLIAKGEKANVRYLNVQPGNYQFWLQAANSDGVWSEPYLALRFSISPPWYKTWWFFTLLILAIALITAFIVRFRISQIREKAELNTRVAENKMAALRSQMNPHFVFNSLQTVNVFIARQDLRGAMEYVNQFARLMRVILENSRAGNISLEREIELLELYMKIESNRFSKPFTFNITVGQEVDTYSMQIPSMLLQPFIENAIKHGLFHKKEGGHINIAFLIENGILKCVVEDNGVGRKKSSELNAQQGRDHQSRGLQIVNERLAIIRAKKPGNYEVKISDLLDRQQNPSGTRVEITLPLS